MPKREQDRGIEQKQPQAPKKLPFASIPAVLKSIIIKFWSAGALFFFFMMSHLTLTIARLDLLVAYGLALGLFINLIINKVLRSFDEGDGKHLKYIIFSKKNLAFILADLVYGIVCVFLIVFAYQGINMLINHIGDFENTHIGFPPEPIGVGIFFVLIDFVFVLLKMLIFKIFGLSYQNDEVVSDDDVIINED
jgi:hypothetical protein